MSELDKPRRQKRVGTTTCLEILPLLAYSCRSLLFHLPAKLSRKATTTMKFTTVVKVTFAFIMVAVCWKVAEITSLDSQVSRSVTDIINDEKGKGSLTSQHPTVVVEEDDYIYSSHLGAAPIVVESHKLIFFYVPKVSCTVWKQVFRRMKGYEDWKAKFPHNSRTNGLTYLNQLNRTYATEIMNSPEWTRAIIVRDPKARFLSAYLDKVLHKNSTYIVGACCKSTQDCWKQAQTFSGFFDLTDQCFDTHWRPQSQRMEPKYLPLLDFVGHVETLESDAKKLLKSIGAWEEYGKSGWGLDGSEPIYKSRDSVHHATSKEGANAWSRLSKFYTPDLERKVEARYAVDYEIARFRLQRGKIDFTRYQQENRGENKTNPQ